MLNYMNYETYYQFKKVGQKIRILEVRLLYGLGTAWRLLLHPREFSPFGQPLSCERQWEWQGKCLFCPGIWQFKIRSLSLTPSACSAFVDNFYKLYLFWLLDIGHYGFRFNSENAAVTIRNDILRVCHARLSSCDCRQNMTFRSCHA